MFGQSLLCSVHRQLFVLHGAWWRTGCKTLIIYQTDNDLEKIHEIVCFENRFDVQAQMKAPSTIHDILPAINGCKAVIVSGIEATLRNGIVKECIVKISAAISFRNLLRLLMPV